MPQSKWRLILTGIHLGCPFLFCPAICTRIAHELHTNCTRIAHDFMNFIHLVVLQPILEEPGESEYIYLSTGPENLNSTRRKNF